MVMHALDSEPLIAQQEFEEIQSLDQYLEENATVVVTDRRYSPWIKGYVGAPVIAPGLFDENLMDQTQWNDFWYNSTSRPGYLNLYKEPLYVHVGSRQGQMTFDDCFSLVHNGTTKLYSYTCGATS
jgi:hypothetical protein